MAQKMRRQDYQPLIDKVNSRFTSWTSRHLSFAGRLQLLKSVIFSSINFWTSVFLLPNQCLRKLEQMYNAFLWKGAPNSARGAKLSWEIVCSSKVCGGLGLRDLVAWNKVLALKLIWMLFTAASSLWVSWVRVNLIRNKNFWYLNPSFSGSWILRRLCKLRTLARPFIVCEVGSGVTANFWLDNWTSHGPLIDLTVPTGPQITGLPRDSTVRDALRGNDWWISASRSRNPIISLIKGILPPVANIAEKRMIGFYGNRITGLLSLFSPLQILGLPSTQLVTVSIGIKRFGSRTISRSMPSFIGCRLESSLHSG